MPSHFSIKVTPKEKGRKWGTVAMCLILRYINEDKITIYVEHPVPLDPPVAEAPAPPMPLMLTAKEKKKIRKQRREEREKERQVCTHWLPGCPSLLVVYMFSSLEGSHHAVQD